MSSKQLFNSLRTGGQWDYKNGGRNPEMEHVGNFNAGVTIAAKLDSLGLSRDMANDFIFAGTQGYALYDTHNFDDPTDQYFIKQGFDYYYTNVKI